MFCIPKLMSEQGDEPPGDGPDSAGRQSHGAVKEQIHKHGILQYQYYIYIYIRLYIYIYKIIIIHIYIYI